MPAMERTYCPNPYERLLINLKIVSNITFIIIIL